MNHNMGWHEIKEASLINDKPRWNPLFHNSAIGKLQVCWTDAHTPWQDVLAVFQLNFSKWWGMWAGLSYRNVSLICPSGAFCQVDGASSGLRDEGKRCLFSLAPFCTDRRTGLCKWQPEPEDVCWLPRGLLQPAGEVSVAPYGAGKINNEEEIHQNSGRLASLSSKQNLKT